MAFYVFYGKKFLQLFYLFTIYFFLFIFFLFSFYFLFVLSGYEHCLESLFPDVLSMSVNKS